MKPSAAAETAEPYYPTIIAAGMRRTDIVLHCSTLSSHCRGERRSARSAVLPDFETGERDAELPAVTRGNDGPINFQQDLKFPFAGQLVWQVEADFER
jgi:hypothetical protein